MPLALGVGDETVSSGVALGAGVGEEVTLVPRTSPEKGRNVLVPSTDPSAVTVTLRSSEKGPGLQPLLAFTTT